MTYPALPKPHLIRRTTLWYCGEWNYRGKFCSETAYDPVTAWAKWNNHRSALLASGLYWEFFPDGGRRP